MRTILLLLACMASGCASTSTDVEGRDSGMILPSLRVQFGEGLHNDHELLPMAQGELELAFASGRSSQDLIAGQVVNFDSRAYNGPVRLEHKYELTALNLSGQVAAKLHERVSLGGIFAFTANTLAIRVKSPTQSNREHTISVGPGLGASLSIAPTDWLIIYGRAIQYAALSDHTKLTFLTSEVGAHFRIRKDIGFILGWRTWEYEAEATEETLIGLIEIDESDIELEWTGFMAALVLSF